MNLAKTLANESVEACIAYYSESAKKQLIEEELRHLEFKWCMEFIKASVKGEKYSTTKHRIIGRIKRFKRENRVPYRVISMKDFRKIILPRNWKSLYRQQKLRLQYKNELAYALDRQ